MDLLLIVVMASSLGQGLPAQDTQVQVALPQGITSECVSNAANRYQVPSMLLLSVIKVESAGRNAVNCKNVGGGCDLGIAQINSKWWAPYLYKNYGVRPEALLYDNCQAVMAQSYIIKKEALSEACRGNLWCGAGRYHSRTPELANRYIAKVFTAQNEILTKGSF